MIRNRIIVKGADFSSVAIEQESIIDEYQVDFSWSTIGKYIKLSNGEEVNLAEWNISNYIDLPTGLLSINGHIFGYETVANIACYDASQNYLGGFAVSPYNTVASFDINVESFPTGTAKIRITSNVVLFPNKPRNIFFVVEVS